MAQHPEKHATTLFRNRSKCSLGKIVQAGLLYLENCPAKHEARRHDHFSFVYLLDGSGSYSDELGVSRRLSPGDLFFTFPNLTHSYGPTEDDAWSEIFVVFDGPVFHLWLEQNVLCPERGLFQLHPISYWERKIREAVEWSRYPNHRKALTQACRLQQLLADILSNENYDSHQQEQKENWAYLAARTLEEEKNLHISWEDLARRAGVSYETFRKRFSKEMGISPARYHMKCLMEHACDLLLSGQCNRDVAEALGFCDEFHFSRRFKQIVGCSPRDFRNHSEANPPRLGWKNEANRRWTA